jgi:hypothetical protein
MRRASPAAAVAWNESPLKSIHHAVTPTPIHFGEQDERIPMPPPAPQ